MSKNINKHSEDITRGLSWFKRNKWKPFPFQTETWQFYLDGYDGLVNAPTGSGKTYSLFVAICLEALRREKQEGTTATGLQAIWIAPLRALTKEIKLASERALKGLGLDWEVGIRSGDTKTTERKKQLTKPPQVLITTPESLHVIMSTNGYTKFFANVRAIVVDEWHELMGSKRGVQTQLAIARVKTLSEELRVWGISATIDNLDEAMDVLLGPEDKTKKTVSKKRKLVVAKYEKKIAIETIIPDDIETYPWAGHLGIRLIEKVLPIIKKGRSTLIFTNTRSQCEIWYQKLLDIDPDLSGVIAMHHGSISRDLREWVEDAIHEERLKAVVCTSSLDLGVDFRPVETIIQIGSPKGVSRFIQRAGRSGHQPGAVSKIYFVPTHSLEMAEGAALRTAIAEGVQEPRLPYIRCFDVLIQYLMTLAVSEGFDSVELFEEVKSTFCYSSLNQEEWNWVINFLQYGGDSLTAYDEYRKIALHSGKYRVLDKHIAKRHKFNIGTIVSSSSLMVKFLSGKKIGTIEEWFIAQLEPGDTFWFAGRSLELVRIKEMSVQVKKSKKKSGKVPSWMGGRMPLSSMLAKQLRRKFTDYAEGVVNEIELEVLTPLFEKQRLVSHLPKQDEFLIEYFETSEGHHLLMYPFEGRFVHEGIGALIASRISRQVSISFSIAMNDYGLELLSDKKMDIDKLITNELFTTVNLFEDIQKSINSIEMARRKFRDIAKISGLVFQGFPGKKKKERHLQSSSALLFDVFKEYDPNNLLFSQTFEEVLTFQLEESRLRTALQRIQDQKLIIKQPAHYSPFSFPIIVDRLNRERVSSESISDKVAKLKAELGL